MHRATRTALAAVTVLALAAPLAAAGDDDRRRSRRDHDRRNHDRYEQRHRQDDHRDRAHRDRDRRDRHRDRHHRSRSYERRHHDSHHDRHRYYRPGLRYRSHRNFSVPRQITRSLVHELHHFVLGRLYHSEHHHYHVVYRFPVYHGHRVAYRPYAYCEGKYFAVGTFDHHGRPYFD